MSNKARKGLLFQVPYFYFIVSRYELSFFKFTFYRTRKKNNQREPSDKSKKETLCLARSISFLLFFRLFLLI